MISLKLSFVPSKNQKPSLLSNSKTKTFYTRYKVTRKKTIRESHLVLAWRQHILHLILSLLILLQRSLLDTAESYVIKLIFGQILLKDCNFQV